MRLLVFLALAVLVIVVLLPRVSAWTRRMSADPTARRDELVKDPVCQTYVVMSRAIRTEVGGATVHFCSRECRDKYARGERRA
jgi:YHS domain-containing protein